MIKSNNTATTYNDDGSEFSFNEYRAMLEQKYLAWHSWWISQLIGSDVSIDEAEDAIHHAFTVALRRRHLKEEGCRNWVLKVARRHLDNLSLKRRPVYIEEMPVLQVAGNNVSSARRAQAREIISGCLAGRPPVKLSPGELSAFVEVDIKGFGQKEAAEATNTPFGSFRQLLSTARKKMRNWLIDPEEKPTVTPQLQTNC